MRILLLLLFALLLPLPSAHAQSLVGSDTEPGDSCAGFAEGVTRMTADADQDGGSVILICDGSVWTAQSAGSGDSGITVVEETPDDCTPAIEGAIRYNSTKATFEGCDGTLWFDLRNGGIGSDGPNNFDFADVTGANPAETIESDIVLIFGMDNPNSVMIGGEGAPEYRICNDNTCSTVAVNWASSTNTISNGQYLQVRTTSNPSSLGTHVVNPIIVGATQVNWSVTTKELKVVFVTSAVYDGDVNGFSGANSRCQGLANTAGLSGTYHAWLSTGDNSNEYPEDRFTKYYLLDYVLTNGDIVASGWTDLVDGTIANPIDINEMGEALGGVIVWTGTRENGVGIDTTATNDCSGYNNNNDFYNGRVGSSSGTNYTWTRDGSRGCELVAHLYCFQQ